MFHCPILRNVQNDCQSSRTFIHHNQALGGLQDSNTAQLYKMMGELEKEIESGTYLIIVFAKDLKSKIKQRFEMFGVASNSLAAVVHL